MTRPRTVSRIALPRRIAQCMTLVVVLGTLTALGCGGSSGTSTAPATASELNDRSFTFANGAGPNLAAVIGLPQGQAFTLEFANFGGTNVGPVTLDSGGSVASGTVTLGSCTFRFDRSTFPAGSGPQSGTQFIIDPCQFNSNNNTLQLTAPSGETLVSSPAIPLPITNVALVLTTNFSTGSYSVVDLTSRNVFKDLKLGGVHSDAIARFFVNPSGFPHGRVYVVNRLGADSIQILDPQLGFITPTNGEISMGSGTNPQDIAFVSTNKAYVSRLASAQLVILNPTTLVQLGVVDLSSLVTPNDSDGSPEPAYMLVHNGGVYVALQHIDFTQPQLPKVANGQVVVINPATDSIMTVIELHGKNPFSEFQFSPTLNRILISSVGDFGVTDGGIEAINPDTNTADTHFAVTEATMGGDITAFVLVSSTKGFAIVSDANFANSLITFDPSSGQRLKTIVGPLNVPMPQLAINSNNEVYLAITDTATTATGLRIFDADTDNEITSSPLNVGQFPPVFTVFIE
jgi:hypothetical protein